MTDPVVQITHVSKEFSGHTAVRDLSLEIPRGGIFGLLGPNGAGKTTTIRMMMGIFTPDAGTIRLFGGGGPGRALSARLGYLPEERGLYPKMRVLDQLVFFGEAKGLSRRVALKKGSEWLERLGLAGWAHRKAEELSKGMQQKVQFICALQHDPELVILDEPFSGLDPVNSQVMKDVVVEIARAGRTVLFSTHIMEQAEKMCDRIAIIAGGEKVLEGTLAEIKRGFGGRHVALVFTRNGGGAAAVLHDRSLVARVDDYGASAEVELANGAESEHLLLALVRAGVGIGRFEIVEPSLQSIFIAQVGADAVTPPGGKGDHA
jgi:ABC-2 type transport system ATP-binding protein